jgi:tetratricopeptide (TPR) repeat protein
MARASNMLSALGLAHFALNELEEAMTSLQEALRIKREIGDREGEATELLAIGNVHLAAKRYAEAERAYIGALAVFRMLDIIDGEIYVYRAMSRLYKEMGREEDAQRALDQVDEARVRLAKT